MTCINFEKSQTVALAKQTAVALVSRKLDDCNSLFHNTPEKDIAELKRAQNCLARVVTKALFLYETNWLPVKFRIHLKICTLTFRTLNTTNLHTSLNYLLGYLLIRNVQTFLTSRKLLNSRLFDMAFPSWFLGDLALCCEPSLAWIMTHDHAKY